MAEKDVRAETAVDPNQTRWGANATEAQRVYEALRESKEAENLRDAILAAAKAANVMRPDKRK